MNPEQQELLKKLAELGNVTYVKSSLSKEELIVKAITEMDIETLEILFENISNFDEKKGFLVEINSEFKKLPIRIIAPCKMATITALSANQANVNAL